MPPRYFRRVFKITAMDSPNVRLGLILESKGYKPTNEILVPGILTWAEYKHRLETWDEPRAKVGIFAEFWEGKDNLLFPPYWLGEAERLADERKGMTGRKAKAIGVDPAEGGDKTAMCVVDEWGILELSSKKTPDTSVIGKEARDLANKWGVEAKNVLFDRGGGGKQIADMLKAQGFHCRSVGFGESLSLDPKRGLRPTEQRLEIKEEKYAYANRRAQMYGELSLLLDPSMIGTRIEGIVSVGFGIPAEIRGLANDPTTELRHQLAPIPKLYDNIIEGKLRLPPKDKPRGAAADSKVVTLKDLIGHSPDESDSLVLAVHGMLHKAHRAVAGAI